MATALSICLLVVLAAGIMAGCWGIFTKAGQPAWASVVPGYNLYVLGEVAGIRWWWLILFLVPFVNFGFWVVVCDELSARFDKGIGHSMGLFWLSFVFFPLLGFGSAEYEGARKRPVEVEEPRRSRRIEEDEEEPRPRRPRPRQREDR